MLASMLLIFPLAATEVCSVLGCYVAAACCRLDLIVLF